MPEGHRMDDLLLVESAADIASCDRAGFAATRDAVMSRGKEQSH